jgi:hypothetical protein
MLLSHAEEISYVFKSPYRLYPLQISIAIIIPSVKSNSHGIFLPVFQQLYHRKLPNKIEKRLNGATNIG